MRLVLDTDVFLAGVRSRRGASRLLLECGLRGRFTWLLSQALFLEYEAVLMRAENLSAANLSEQDAEQILAGVAEAITAVPIDFLWRPQLSDPGDEMVLETAVNGRVRYLVSFNTRHFVRATARFGIMTMRPGDLLVRYPEVFQ